MNNEPDYSKLGMLSVRLDRESLRLFVSQCRTDSKMTNKHPSNHLSFIFLLIFCPNLLTASQQCECQSPELYAFRSLGNEGLVLDGSDTEKITVQHLNGSDAQYWKLQPVGKLGLFHIINEHHGKALDFRIGDGGTPFAALRDLEKKSLQQQWNFDVDGHIVNAANLKHMDIVKANYVVGNHLIIWKDNGCRCQRFLLEKKV